MGIREKLQSHSQHRLKALGRLPFPPAEGFDFRLSKLQGSRRVDCKQEKASAYN